MDLRRAAHPLARGEGVSLLRRRLRTHHRDRIIIVLGTPHMHRQLPEMAELRLSWLTVLGLVWAIAILKWHLHKQPPIAFFRAIGFNSCLLGWRTRIFYRASWLGLAILLISTSHSVIASSNRRASFYELFFGNMLATVVLAPILEEVLFRGLIFSCFRQAFINKGEANWRSEAAALLISSALFALSHFNPASFFSEFGMALVLGFDLPRHRVPAFRLSVSQPGESVLSRRAVHAVGDDEAVTGRQGY